MTRREIRLALMEMEELGIYTLRVFLDGGNTVLAHEWYLEDGFAGDPKVAGGTEEGFLHVVVRGRHALIAVSRIAMLEMLPVP